ncbi:hypothetical protein [Pedobacter gandavensis]|uniref:Uncharacterized protein n=1 Tax=Pedobacter gandavensis TaxID=2679963 RepID=A0ABR6ETV0_9SPHI|nr:hypothetical protein [Pedobacter gandavensis]MBB2148686.1 hypothetical protein [Pedobacter gandavensis]
MIPLKGKQWNYTNSLIPICNRIPSVINYGIQNISGKCNFDNLYAREVKAQYNSNLTYTFAAAFCKYLIDQYGLEYFYKLYYDQEITTDNFMQKVTAITGKTEQQIKNGVEGIILGNTPQTTKKSR